MVSLNNNIADKNLYKRYGMRKIIFTFCLLFLFVCSCTKNRNRTMELDEFPVIATKSIVNGSPVITCDFNLIGNDTIDFPVGALIDSLEIVFLENRDEAIVSRYHTFMSDNYIGVYTMEKEYKLFDKKGRFLNTIGRKGQGPGEYTFLYDSNIDEENNRIYLMPWNQKKIFIYDLKGNFLGDIPLPEFVPKARFKVDTENEVITVLILPFKGQNKHSVLHMDFEGNMISSLDSSPFALEPDFGNEVLSYRNSENIDYYIMGWPYKQDTLFYYLPGENRLQPVFTLKFGNVDPFSHYYMDLPGYVLTIRAEQERPDVNGVFYAPAPKMFIVEKESLRGGWVNIVIDELGGIPIPSRTYFQDGYFIMNMYPHELKENLASVLTGTGNQLPEDKIDKIRNLYNQIDEDGNNIIISGRLK